MSKILDAALSYAERGLAVIPTKPKSNEPFLPDWPNQATTDKNQIEKWWNENPNYNVAIVTGKKNHLLVLDLDLDEVKGKYAYDFARDWQREHAAFPENTWLCKTAHGGYHLYFWNDQPQKSPTDLFFRGSGVDVRADGACVVAPPSVREGNLCYEWEQGPDEFDLQPINDAVRQFVSEGETEKKNVKRVHPSEDVSSNFEMPDDISEGSRTGALVSLIGSLRAKNLSEDAIRAAVEAENESRCNPPLTDQELEKEVFPALTRNWKAAHPYFKREAAKPDKGLIEKLLELDAANTFSQTDKGFAEMYVAMFGSVSRYNPTKREYMFYDGVRWVLDLESMRAKNNAKKLADALRVYAASYTDLEEKSLVEYTKHALKLMTNRTREIMVKDAKDLNFFQSEQLDEDDYLLNCQNGVLDLSGSEPVFIGHDPELLLSKVCNAEYDADAKSILWENSVAEIMEYDVEKIQYIQKLLGLALTGCAKEEEMYFFYGSTSRNGKSTIAETVLYLLGDYGATLSPESLASKSKDSRQASPDMAKLQGVRLVVASEPPKRMLFDVSLVKTLTGRDRITARHLYESEISFVPKFKLLINTNYLPLITDDTIFKSERIRVINFNRHFSPEEQKKELKDQLRNEMSGILNWMLDGWHMYQKEGLEPPQPIKDSTQRYQHESDKIGMFFEDCLVEFDGNNLAAKDVYEHYNEWCADTGQRAEGRKNFYVELRSRGKLAESGTIGRVTVRNVVPGYAFVDDFEVPFE